MKVDKVSIITRSQMRRKSPHYFEDRIKKKFWQLLFIEVKQRDENGVGFYWTCIFTPWRLFATFFVTSSKYYKARMEPW